MLKQLIAAVMGGIMIAIGGCVYLNSLGSAYLFIDTAVGAFFFSVALVCICLKGYGLFTGRVGYLPDNFTKKEAGGLLMTLIGNALATFLVGSLIFLTMQTGLGALAREIVASKLLLPWYITLLRAVLCGVLMYLAVSIYKEKGSVLGIVFCVPAFILAGFEHSIADMFYVAAGGFVGGARAFGFLLLVIVGNAIGGMLLPILTRFTKDPPEKTEEEAGEEAYKSMFIEDAGEEAPSEEKTEEESPLEVEA